MVKYTDNQSLHNAVHSSKQMLERRFIVDISPIHEMVDNNQVQVIWIEKDKQINNVLTKFGVSILNILESSQILSI